MHMYFVGMRSANPITGPIMVTTSPGYTCPAACALKGKLCYAEHGFLGGFIWNALDKAAVGNVIANGLTVKSLTELALAIGALPLGTVWRHNQVGDLMPDFDDRHLVCGSTLTIICEANKGRRGFTFTHFDPSIDHNWRAIRSANQSGFRINLSANDHFHADMLADTGCGPVHPRC